MFITNKYSKWYFLIISYAKAREHLSGYSENHHIIPKSLGGQNNLENKVRLTAREHYVCHRLLTKMVKGKDRNKMFSAWHALSHIWNKNQKREKFKITSRSFSILREGYAKSVSERMKGKIVSQDTKKKLSEAQKGKYLSVETKNKISIASKSRIQTEKQKEKRSESLKSFHSKSNNLFVCEKCGCKSKIKTNITRWHNQNCGIKIIPSFESNSKRSASIKTLQWINRDGINKRVEHIENFIINGWNLGRSHFNRRRSI